MKQLIQIAGVRDQDEAELIAGCGATHLGFPLRLPVHREDLSEPAAARIIQQLPPGVSAVLITYLSGAREIEQLCRELGFSIVQLHGDVTPGVLAELKTIAPDLTVIKSLIVREPAPAGLIHLAAKCEPSVDAFIMDSFDPDTGARGATGRMHDWTVSRAVVEAVNRPVILAGGLTPDNVRRAIQTVKPAGVDAHTGVEDMAGRKDRRRVEAFVAEAREGFAAI